MARIIPAKLGEEHDLFLEVADFIARDVFGDQFTLDAFLDGYEGDTVPADMVRMLGRVRGLLEDALAVFPPAPEPGEGVKNERPPLKVAE